RLVVHYSGPLLILHAKVLDAPADGQRATHLFRRLLELNASDLVHGAYAIEEGDVILTDTIELDHLDFETLQASVDSVQLALASHREALAAFREGWPRCSGAAAPRRRRKGACMRSRACRAAGSAACLRGRVDGKAVGSF